ncbi:DUF6572 domain-containing protein [Brevibacillus sp. SYSU BS000544]|uniref:DUF6572 domain-containing protein n=1 Tax=Brevibacillus sp. SYSU BS000544 TaxID=3416443 RepID=UPI003CE4FFA7
MTIEQTRVIDLIGIDNQTGNCILTISDHLDWEDELFHLYLLQEKLNSYLAFVESGEIFETYSQAKGRNISFMIYFAHDLPEIAEQFLKKAQHFVTEAGFELCFKVFPSTEFLFY